MNKVKHFKTLEKVLGIEKQTSILKSSCVEQL